MMSDNLFVNRLYVLTDTGQTAYDERFHHGVNIIRGDNSSGKSTVTHLLFYALGGDYTHFVPQARRCARVMVEVETGHAVITLSRPIDKDADGHIRGQQGMTVYWGTLDEALAGNCDSQTFGYRMSANRSSFSNVLFGAMNIPVAHGDSNITMHQLLRLMYIDQESPTQSLYFFEQFDNQTTRETVADLMLGIFDYSLYEAKLRQKELAASIADTKADIRATETSLPKEQRSTEHINSLIDHKSGEIKDMEESIRNMRNEGTADSNKKTLTEQKKAELRQLSHEYDKAEELVDELEHNVEDTRMFIDELSRKRTALQHSASTRQILGNLRLEYCPECLSPLPDDVPDGTCRLCKSPVENHTGVTQAKRIIAELSFQLQESQAILTRDETRLAAAKIHMRSLNFKRRTARRSLDALLDTVRSRQEEAIEDLIYRKGLAEGELLQYYTLLERAEYYEHLNTHLQQLQAEHNRVCSIVHDGTARQEKRRDEVTAKMQEHGVYLLHHDKECQRAFVDARRDDFHVDFSNNMVYLQDRHNRYSASSSFFLKLVARFSLFLASLDIPWMRYPRFIFADNMEDKGIEMQRAQMFQQTLIDHLAQYPADSYQVIYTTSYITDELDHSEYVVGEHYNMNNKSLKNV